MNLDILFVPLDAVGHVNSAVGIAQVLLRAGHKCRFVVTGQWRGRLIKYGIEETILSDTTIKGDVSPADHWAQWCVKAGLFKESTVVNKRINLIKNIYEPFISGRKKLDSEITLLLKTYRPDVIIADQTIVLPSVVTSGIPWVLTVSCNPAYILWDEDLLPPPGSGLPTQGPKSLWNAYMETVNEATNDIWVQFNNYLKTYGIQELHPGHFILPSKYLNIYAYPKELDYTDIRPLPSNYTQFDHFMRQDSHPAFDIPVPLRDKPGKLVYLSMGSMGGAQVELMRRLVTILSKSPNRFLVSTGPLGHKYTLGSNMWGRESVLQLEVLPVVDLVVTHGGNNTVTETLYFGKPMIVLPLFSDQFNNGQRVHELGYGVRLDPYRCSESELLVAVERLLSDTELNEKLRVISRRIQSDECLEKLPKLVESLVNNNNF